MARHPGEFIQEASSRWPQQGRREPSAAARSQWTVEQTRASDDRCEREGLKP